MKLIIDISEEIHKSIQDNDYCGISNSDIYNAIKNGKPLKEGIMLKCPNCGLDVHSDFKTCPRCGADMRGEI